jgi:hypothetical protein
MADGEAATAAECVTLEDMLGLVRRLDSGPVRDIELLGARHRPTASENAVVLLPSIVMSHALVAGNKRLG